jgi:DNA-binding GntR family transcriptional regulator
MYSGLMSRETELNRMDAVRERAIELVLEGQWAPGANIPIRELSDLTGKSATVAREALSRLAGDGLVEAKPNRGFFVPQLTFEEISDLTEFRILIESKALVQSIERGTVEWESRIVAALHQLTRVASKGELNGSQVEWTRVHREFHDTLISACGIDIVRRMARSLSDSTVLYRKSAVPTMKAHGRDIIGEHRALADAVIARDSATATDLLSAHYRATVESIAEALAVSAEPSTAG